MDYLEDRGLASSDHPGHHSKGLPTCKDPLDIFNKVFLTSLGKEVRPAYHHVLLRSPTSMAECTKLLRHVRSIHNMSNRHILPHPSLFRLYHQMAIHSIASCHLVDSLMTVYLFRAHFFLPRTTSALRPVSMLANPHLQSSVPPIRPLRTFVHYRLVR